MSRRTFVSKISTCHGAIMFLREPITSTDIVCYCSVCDKAAEAMDSREARKELGKALAIVETFAKRL